jgi:hypothetical protein
VIIFDLKCAPQGHVFEAWFGSSVDYESQQARGLVACPLCASTDIAKAPMAPAVPARSGDQPSGPELLSGAPAQMKAMLAAAASMQKQLLEKSESVGDRFAEEARAIHLGEADARAIHGCTTRRQAESLIEDGIPIAPLPFPVVEPGQEN